MTRDGKEFVEWLVWALVFGAIIAASLWSLAVEG